MHNRNFVINMVINGEKAPAFNATTLTLPIPQLDNTGRIIENTRRNYSRNRSDVEYEIAATLKPLDNQRLINPRVREIKWPVGIAPVGGVSDEIAGQSTLTAPVRTEVEAVKPKRKRIRTRKKKTTEATIANHETPAVGGELKIKHKS